MDNSTNNARKRRRAGPKKMRKTAGRVRGRDATPAANAGKASVAEPKKKSGVLAIAAASGALLHAAIKMLTPSRGQ